MQAPRLALVHIPPYEEDASDVARDMRGRLPRLVEMGPALGLDIAAAEARDVLSHAPGTGPAIHALRGAAAVWWLGRITFLPEMRAVVEKTRAHLDALRMGGAPATPILDDPDAVEEAFSLARFYPLLERAGVPQAATTFLPLTDEEVALPEDALRALLRGRIDREPAITFARGPVFFRTFYGTLKIAGGLNGAYSADDLAEAGARMIARLRVGQANGGLAVREVLPIVTRFLKKSRAMLRREIRVFVVSGTPVFWALAGHHGDYQVAKIPRDALAEIARTSDAQRAEVRAIAARAAAALRVRLLVVDFALLEDGRIFVLETNPGHACGWCHPAAYASVYAAMMRAAVGLEMQEPRGLAGRLGIDLSGEGETFGFFVEGGA